MYKMNGIVYMLECDVYEWYSVYVGMLEWDVWNVSFINGYVLWKYASLSCVVWYVVFIYYDHMVHKSKCCCIWESLALKGFEERIVV